MCIAEIERFAADLKTNETLRAEPDKVQADKSHATPMARAVAFAASKRLSMNAEEAMASLASLDLSAVKRKVVDEKGWGVKIADYAELRYRRFLCMHLINPRLLLVPPPDIDAFWHRHILFTRQYVRDCETLFGTFLHHSPASGEEGEAAAMQQGAMETAKFYADTFGEHYFAVEPEGLASNWLELFD